MKNWETIKSKIVFECKYMKVLEEDFLLPNREKHKYYILKRSRYYVVVIAKEDNCFYLIEQYRYTTKSKLLQAVAGAVWTDEVVAAYAAAQAAAAEESAPAEESESE